MQYDAVTTYSEPALYGFLPILNTEHIRHQRRSDTWNIIKGYWYRNTGIKLP